MDTVGADRTWKVVRDDGTELGRYLSKPQALAAAIRFSTDGCGYEVVEDRATAPRAPAGALVRLQPL